jgi:hypothetical protein
VTNLFPNLRKIPPDIDTVIKSQIVDTKFAFNLMHGATAEHEEILIAFIRDWNGFLDKTELCCGNSAARHLRELLPTGFENGLFLSKYGAFTSDRFRKLGATSLGPNFVCAMPFMMAGHLKTDFWPPVTDNSVISFVQYATSSIYNQEVFAQFIPEKHALTLNPYAITLSFNSFRQLAYAIIAAERITLSDMPLEEKYAKVFYCALSRYAAEHTIEEMDAKVT